MSGGLRLFNRQRRKTINRLEWRRFILCLLTDLWSLEEFDLAIHFVSAAEMARQNMKHLGHSGSTDVITLDYAGGGRTGPLCGEIYICVDDAETQARHFKAHWDAELARYAIHGLLHLRGWDDLNSRDRREMRRQESRWLRELSGRFSLSKPAAKTTLRA